jgi:hypothetical protein
MTVTVDYAGRTGIYTAILGTRVKVGYTTDLPRRLAALRNGRRRRPILVDFVQMPTRGAAFDAEQAVHRRFQEHRVGPETYPLALLPELVDAVRAEARP